MVAETAEQVTLLEQKSALEREAGLEVEMLDRDVAGPPLGPSILAAAFCPGRQGRSQALHAGIRQGRDATRRRIPAASACTLRRNGHGWRAWHRRRRIDPGRRRRAGRGHLVRPYRADGRRDASRRAVGLTMAATARTAPFIKHLVQHAGRRLSMKQTQEGNVLIGGGWPAALAQTDGVVDLESQPELLLPSWRAA